MPDMRIDYAEIFLHYFPRNNVINYVGMARERGNEQNLKTRTIAILLGFRQLHHSFESIVNLVLPYLPQIYLNPYQTEY